MIPRYVLGWKRFLIEKLVNLSASLPMMPVVVRLRFEAEGYVDRAVLLVRLYVGLHVLGVEVAGLGDFAQ